MDLQERPLVSVIVPVYNAELYISKCIESILDQTYRNFELILVNDGSTDKSGVVCDDYAQKDHRIRVVHLTNGGVSRARNTGMSCAKGEYLFFVDADDWVDPDFIKYMLPLGEEDLVYVGYTKDYPDGRVERVGQTEETVIIEGNRDFGQLVYMTFVVCGCFSAHICRSHALTFDEKIAAGEDVRFILRYLKHCSSIRFTDRADYHYRQNPASALHRYHPDKREQQKTECMMLEDFMGKDDMQQRWYRWSVIRNHYSKWIRSNQSAGNVQKDARRRLKETYEDAYFRSCLPAVRESGSIDQKIETYFMHYRLHLFYAPVYRALLLLSRLKRLVKRG